MERIEFSYTTSLDGHESIKSIAVNIKDDGRPWVELVDDAEATALELITRGMDERVDVELWEE